MAAGQDPEKLRAYRLKYRLNNKEKLLASAAAYRQTDKGKLACRIKESKRRARKRGNGGSHTIEEWRELVAKYNRCLRCGLAGDANTLEQDHITPLCKNGTDDIDNIQPLCKPCNGAGGKWKDIIDYREAQ